MVIINADSIAAARDFVRKRGLEAKAAATKQYRSHIMRLYRELLLIYPQYSGDSIANWDIETDVRAAREYVQTEMKGKVIDQPIYEAGEISPGFNSAYARGLARMRDVTQYGQPVLFVNNSPVEIDSPIVVGPDGVSKLRDPDVVAAWMSITSYLQARFGALP